jgi:hypothetical protein
MQLLEKGAWPPVPGMPGWPTGRQRTIRYRARFWDGPTEAGQTGRYVDRVCDDVLYEKMRGRPDGTRYLHRGFLSTAPSASYYGDLMRLASK